MENGSAEHPSNSALAADIRDLRTTLYGDPIRRIVGIVDKLDTLITAEGERVKKEAVRDAQIKLILWLVGLTGFTNVMAMLSTIARGFIP